jgi:hypothetical protein
MSSRQTVSEHVNFRYCDYASIEVSDRRLARHNSDQSCVVNGGANEMSFDRQLDLLVTILTTVVVFVGCTFYGALSVKISLLIAAAVCLAGLVFGKGIRKILDFF